jgi:hypothetical protein
MDIQLSRNIFWDTHYDSIQWDQHGAYVIDRVLHYGALSDWKKVLAYYGKDKVRDTVQNLRYLDRRVLSYCAVFFNLPKESFRCYNTEPSLKEQWNY